MGSVRMMSATRNLMRIPATRRSNTNQVGDAARKGASENGEELRRDECAVSG